MMLFRTKACLTLLWGISALFSTGTKSLSIPETSSSNSTAEPNKANGPLTTEHVPYNETETQPTSWDPTQQPAKVTVAAKVEATVSPTMETEEIVVSNRSDSMAGLVVMNTVATATNSSTVARSPLLHTSTAAVTAAGDAQRSHSTVISETAKPTADRLVKQSPSTSTDVAAPTTTPTATTTNSSTVASPALLHTSTAEATTAGDARGSHNTDGQLGEQSPSASTDMAAPATTSSAPASSASTKTTMTTNSTSEAAPVFSHNSLSFTTTETPTTSAEHLPTSQPISGTRARIATSQSPDSTGSSFTTETLTSTVLNGTSTSNGSARILKPNVPKMVPSTRSTPATAAAPCEASTNPPSTGGQPCSTRGVVKHCLIAIASLAALATIFMVSTVVLCTKLSARKYKVKKRPQATEMMCISALLPERNYTYTRQRNPVSNGVLVIPNGRDSDEEGGDNLTLSSFLPENDRIV